MRSSEQISAICAMKIVGMGIGQFSWACAPQGSVQLAPRQLDRTYGRMLGQELPERKSCIRDVHLCFIPVVSCPARQGPGEPDSASAFAMHTIAGAWVPIWVRPGNGRDGGCAGRRPQERRPPRCADQPSRDGEVRSPVRKAAQAPGSKRNTSPAALLSRTPMRPPASRAVSTQCPLLMLYELFRQPSPRLHSSPSSPAGVLSPIYNPSVPLRRNCNIT